MATKKAAQIYGQDPLSFIRDTVWAIQDIKDDERTYEYRGPVGHIYELTPLQLAQEYADEIDKAARLLERGDPRG